MNSFSIHFLLINLTAIFVSHIMEVMNKDKLKIAVVGLSHQSAGIEDRETFEIDKKEIRESLSLIFNIEAVESVLILNTCNRLEFYIETWPNVEPIDIIKEFYGKYRSINIEANRNIFYTKTDADATRHLFRVISGLDSLVLGEYQIQGQVRDAYSLACESKTLDKTFHKLFHAAFRCGKSIRNETSIGDGKQSVSGVASGLFLDNCTAEASVTIIGVNENTRIIAGELAKANYQNITFVNRTLYKAEMMAEEFGGKAVAFDKIMHVLSYTDAVFSCTGAPGYIVNSQMLHSLAKRDMGPKLIIDMAVPRDFNTSDLPDSIKTFDISDLKAYLDKQQKKQSEDLPKAISIIENEVNLFTAWSDYSGSDLLKPYAEKFEMTRQQLLEEYRTLFPDKSFEKAEKMSKQLLHRLQATFISVLTKSNGK